jgi:hypothetical protein
MLLEQEKEMVELTERVGMMEKREGRTFNPGGKNDCDKFLIKPTQKD